MTKTTQKLLLTTDIYLVKGSETYGHIFIYPMPTNYTEVKAGTEMDVTTEFRGDIIFSQTFKHDGVEYSTFNEGLFTKFSTTSRIGIEKIQNLKKERNRLDEQIKALEKECFSPATPK